MEKNSSGKEDWLEPPPARDVQDMDSNNWRKSYINEPAPENRKHDEYENEEYAEWSPVKLHQKITEEPDGNKSAPEINYDIEGVDKSSSLE